MTWANQQPFLFFLTRKWLTRQSADEGCHRPFSWWPLALGTAIGWKLHALRSSRRTRNEEHPAASGDAQSSAMQMLAKLTRVQLKDERADYEGAEIGHSQFAANVTLEDRVKVAKVEMPSGDATLGIVADGHGGWQIAAYVSRLLPDALETAIKEDPGRWASGARDVMTHVFESVDLALLSHLEETFHLGLSRVVKVGACAVAVLVEKDQLVVANSGDCRAVLCRSGKAIPLNTQHTADCPHEQKRLRARHPEPDIVVCKETIEQRRSPGAFWHHPLHWTGTLGKELVSRSCYVKGRLQPTRSFGDFHLKAKEFAYDNERNVPFVKEPHSFPYISVKPDVNIVKRSAGDEFVVMGSDGVWDTLTPAKVVEVVRTALSKGTKIEDTAKLVIDAALESRGLTRDAALELPVGKRRAKYDDTTVLVIRLR